MADNSRKKSLNNQPLSQTYLDIINAMPNIVYWIDNDCQLQGCNQNFVKLLNLKQMKDFKSTPYELMLKAKHGSTERIEAFRLDDLQVIFSGVAQHETTEQAFIDKQGRTIHYLCTRVPLLAKNKEVVGLVVILADLAKYTQPEVKTSSKSPAKKKKINPPQVTEPHVLMVEDNFIAQKVEEALLTALHCHVDIAESGDIALKLFNPGKYDIVFMDLGLEDTSGYAVAKKLRQMEKNTRHHVPIIALTTYQADIVQYDCKDYFMDGVITKPLTSDQVKQIIQHFIYHEDVEVTGLKGAGDPA